MSENTADLLINEDSIDQDQEDALLKSDDEQMPSDGGGGSSDSSDDEHDDEESRLIKEYIEVLGQIDENKYCYEHYIKLIDTAHKLFDLDKIRQSCELFSSVYPLAPEIWLRWLKNESGIASSATEIEQVEALFRRALNDYYCANVALEFGKFAAVSPNVEAIWAELFGTYAIHCMKGRQFFEVWKKYFDEIENLEQSEKNQKFAQICIKMLMVPHYDMEETYIEFKVFCEKYKPEINVDWGKIDEKYNRAKDHLQRILPFEKEIADLDPKFHLERASLYKKYIDEADRFIDENILQSLHERMVTECCLNADCWLEYCTYLEKRDRYGRPTELDDFPVFRQSDMDIVNRAIRNCTWSEKLYVKKMRIAEKKELPKTDVQVIIEQALEAGFQTPEPAVALWLEYLAYLRRQTNYTNEREVDLLRANFNLAWTSLGRLWGVLADCNCEILQFWGRLEYGPLQDIAKGKELWTTVMESSDNASKSGLWIEFAHLELKKGPDAARKVYKKALAIPTIDNIYVISSAWQRFERCNGTLEQVAACQEQCEISLSAYEVMLNKKGRMSQDVKPKGLKAQKRRAQDEPQSSAEQDEGKEDVFLKPQPVAHRQDDVGSSKKARIEAEARRNSEHHHEHLEVDTSRDNIRIFISNLDYNVSEDEIQEAFPELSIENVNLIKASNGRGRGFGYVELKSSSDVAKALTFDRRMIKGRPVYISSVLRDKDQRVKFKYSETLEPTKLFVKGIPYVTTKDELEELFKPHGKLKDVRIVYHKSGKSKGIAYIEYEEESAASAAVLKLDGYILNDFKLSVAISAPPPKPQSSSSMNVTKLLGMGTKKPINRSEQKPRMTLIPTSVRQNASKAKPSNGVGAQAEKMKTNDDFRKLLTK